MTERSAITRIYIFSFLVLSFTSRTPDRLDLKPTCTAQLSLITCLYNVSLLPTASEYRLQQQSLQLHHHAAPRKTRKDVACNLCTYLLTYLGKRTNISYAMLFRKQNALITRRQRRHTHGVVGNQHGGVLRCDVIGLTVTRLG